MVLNANDFEIIKESDNELVQRFRPVFIDGARNSLVRAQFYVSRKNVFGSLIETYAVNLAVIWFMTLTLAIMLYYNVFKMLLKAGSVFEKKSKA